MSSLSKNYDKISGVYRDIAKNIYEPTLKTSMAQIQKYIDPHVPHAIIDLGCGGGETLRQLHAYFPQAQCTGVDISLNMLKEAALKLPLTTIQSDLAGLNDSALQKQFDLCVAHFVLGYVDLSVLLNKAKELLKDQGYLSIATNSETSFQGVKQTVRDSFAHVKLLKKLVDFKIKKGMEKSCNSKIDWEHIHEVVGQLGFDVLSFETVKITFEFKNAHELFDYIFYGSWGISELKPYVPIAFYRFFYTTILTRWVTFPFKDDASVHVLLLATSHQPSS